MGLGVASCESYLDINQDPNSPSEENVTTGMIMPAAEMSIAGSYGDFLFITGGYLHSTMHSSSVHPTIWIIRGSICLPVAAAVRIHNFTKSR